MPFDTLYQLHLKNDKGSDVYVNISDTLSGDNPSPTPIPLKCQSVVIKVVNDDEDKFAIIRGKRVEITYIAETAKQLSIFTSPEDNRWLVEVLVGATQIFSGFLVTDAMSEPFLPVSHNYSVRLAASDNLGLLKDIPLTKPDSTNPRGRFRLIEYVSWCLRKTGFDLPINVVYNLRPSELLLSGDHTFHRVYLNAKTFEADINESIPCYDVLERLLKGCFLTQENNEWWIVRVDEMDGGDLFSQSFDPDGTIGGPIETISLSKNIGSTETIKLIEKDAQVMLERPVKFDKLTYKFEFPEEIIDNMDFSRGTSFIAPISVDMSLHIHSYANLAAFPVTGDFQETYKALDSGLYYRWNGAIYVNITGAEIPSGGAYVLEDWSISRIGGGTTSATPYVVKVSQLGSEKARYAVIGTSGTSAQHILTSNPVPVDKFDRFIFSVDRRLGTDRPSSTPTTEFALQIKLTGEDGSVRTIRQDGTWQAGSGSIFTVYYPANSDETEWKQLSVDATPVPVAGTLTIHLYQTTFYSTYNTHFANMSFSYIPYTNGSYQKYNSVYHKVSHTIPTKNKREETVYISDRIKPLFKGGLELKTVGGQYYTISGWYNYNQGLSGELAVAPFTKYNVFEYWNQNNRIIRSFEGSLIGLDSATPTDMPGLLHQYVFTAATDHTTNKTFMLLSYSMDLDSERWSGIFAEVYDSTIAKLYNSDYESKYTTDNE